MKKKLAILLALVLSISTVLIGCGSKKENNSESTSDESSNKNPTEVGSGDITPTGEAVYGGSVIVGITQDLDSLDPHKAVAAGTNEVLYNIFEGLVKPAKDGSLIPAVAEKYSISQDGKEYSFVLREGVTFHNGAKVTVEDVIYSIKRVAGKLDVSDPEIKTESALSIISDVSAYTAEDGKAGVKITLSQSNTELLGYLTGAIIPKDYDNQAEMPIGTGPFKYVSYSPLQSFVIEKYKDYYNADDVHLDGVTFLIFANTDAAFIQLMAGAIDIFPYLTDEQAEQLKENYNILCGASNLVQALFLNNNAEPFNIKEVRQALFYAIDAKEIVDIQGNGYGSIIRSNMFPAFEKYFNNALKDTYSYNPDKARELLAQAGYPNGFKFTIIVPSNYAFHIETAQIIVEQLLKVGIEASISTIEWGSWVSEVYKGRSFEATVVGLDSNLAPSDVLKRYRSTASNNFVNFVNSDFDEKFAKASETVDDAEKVKLYKELQTILNEDAASVYIQDPALKVAVNKKLGGYTFYPVYVQDMASVYYIGTAETHNAY